MTDWKRLAEAQALSFSDSDTSRMVFVMEALEAAFRPISDSVEDDCQSALVFRISGDAG